MIIKFLSFDEILPIWSIYLWPDRKSKILPISNVGYKNSLCDINDPDPYFYGIFLNEKCIGVNSCIVTNIFELRSRGLWVSPEHRGKGISKLLLNEAIRYADKEWNAKMIWSMPRKSALPAYLSVGYEQTTDFFDEGVEFGPNCYVRMEL